MPVFERLDNSTISKHIRSAKRRILVGMPGFADDVGTALIEAYRRLNGRVTIIVDGGDHAARLGYGHFDAIKLLADANVPVRIERGLRLGIVVVDDLGWCFASPPLLVDATMEGPASPNAMVLLPPQVEAALAAVTPTDNQPPVAGVDIQAVELGRMVATPAEIEQTHASLEANPPQRFDIARKVSVFNAFVEFVELELLGTNWVASV